MGRPESSFKWFVYKSTHRDFVEEVEMSGISSLDRSTGSCSPRGHSTLAIMITRADQRVKCVVQQQTGKETVEVSDERVLDVQYSVTDTEVGVKVNEKFKETAEEILVRQGDSVRLTCQSRGNPEPIFSWSYLPLQGHTKGSGLNVLAEQPDLLLTNVTSNHSASYVCVATNFIRGKKQTETKTVRIIVKEKMFSNTRRLENESGFTNPALRYGMIVGTVLGSMILVLLISLLSVIIYRRCTRMEDRKYLVQYQGVKA
ncbi:cell adhesion molecule 1-like [Liolophura sinensis]|uniref:cell adhesion molecule 1-like n=1 Tax=Liolophura sinensis TaxID=3198878 RepID=UPI0031583FD4